MRVRWTTSLAILAPLVTAAALTSCWSGDHGDGSEDGEFQNEQAGVSVGVPTGWHATIGRFTGLLVPRERLVLTSFPVKGKARSPGCSPDGLLRQLPHDGVAALLLEYRHTGARWNFPRRPKGFRLGSAEGGSFECFTPQPLGDAHLFNFREAGRAFNLLIAIGKNATAETRHAAKQALDSLRVEHCDPPLPTATHPACRRPLPH